MKKFRFWLAGLVVGDMSYMKNITIKDTDIHLRDDHHLSCNAFWGSLKFFVCGKERPLVLGEK